MTNHNQNQIILNKSLDLDKSIAKSSNRKVVENIIITLNEDKNEVKPFDIVYNKPRATNVHQEPQNDIDNKSHKSLINININDSYTQNMRFQDNDKKKSIYLEPIQTIKGSDNGDILAKYCFPYRNKIKNSKSKENQDLTETKKDFNSMKNSTNTSKIEYKNNNMQMNSSFTNNKPLITRINYLNRLNNIVKDKSYNNFNEIKGKTDKINYHSPIVKLEIEDHSRNTPNNNSFSQNIKNQNKQCESYRSVKTTGNFHQTERLNDSIHISAFGTKENLNENLNENNQINFNKMNLQKEEYEAIEKILKEYEIALNRTITREC
jgi:hypothetical protein